MCILVFSCSRVLVFSCTRVLTRLRVFEREKVIWGTSIFQDEPVFFKKRTYQRDGYVSIALEVSLTQQLCVRKYCREQAAAEVPFDKTGMYMAYLPIQVWSGRGTFCSKHITQALQHGGVIPAHCEGGGNPALSTPSKLHKFIVGSKNRAIVHGIPSRMANGDAAKWTGLMSRDMVRSLIPIQQGGVGGSFGGAMLLRSEDMRQQSRKLGERVAQMVRGGGGVRVSRIEVEADIINNVA